MTYLVIYINGHPVCPECYGNDFITDLFHAEIYCSQCGLVIKDNTISNVRTAKYLMDKQDNIDREIKDYLKDPP